MSIFSELFIVIITLFCNLYCPTGSPLATIFSIWLIFSITLSLKRKPVTKSSSSPDDHDEEDSSNKSAKSLKAKLQQEGCERDSREALEYVWKLAQRHASRMFQVRQEVHENLSLNEIGELRHLVMNFVSSTERKTGRRGDILTNALQQQMEKQLQRVHSNQMQELVASFPTALNVTVPGGLLTLCNENGQQKIEYVCAVILV